MREGWSGGDFSRAAIILDISSKRGDYLREAINQGMAITRRNALFQWLNITITSHLFTCRSITKETIVFVPHIFEYS